MVENLFSKLTWNTWNVNHINEVVHLPSRLAVKFSLFDPQKACGQDYFDWRNNLGNLGMHAFDGSYSEITIRWENREVKMEFASQGGRLACRIILQKGAEVNLNIHLSLAWVGEGQVGLGENQISVQGTQVPYLWRIRTVDPHQDGAIVNFPNPQTFLLSLGHPFMLE